MKFAILFILICSPLPFASASPIWQWTWIVFIGATCSLYFVRQLAKPQHHQIRSIPKAPVFLATIIILGALMQHLHASSNASILTENTPWMPSAVDANFYVKAKVVALFIANLLLYTTTYSLVFSEKITLSTYFQIIMTIVVAYALYGFIMHVTSTEYILWVKKQAYIGSLTSTFVNKNSFATYLGLGLFATCALCAQHFAMLGANKTSLNARLIQGINTKVYVYILALFLLLSCLLLTASRAGIMATFAGLVVFAILVIPSKRSNTINISIGTTAILGLLVLFSSLSGSTFENRLANSNKGEQRIAAYENILEAIKDHPVTGTGLGSFQQSFQYYRSEEIFRIFDRGHNDFLELMMTFGIPITILLLCAIVYQIRVLVKALKSSDRNRPFIAAGLSMAMQIALHSSLDFSLQLPAVSFLFVVLWASTMAIATKSVGKPIHPG